ncbi:MAG: UbiA family prenyltransferase [Candidatus Zambryskibacteria bacterium]|nr:UbiA family prenyltransferase [Candidatus Zambryskibacteria bacterium]
MDVRRNTIYTAELRYAPESTLILDIDGTLVPDKSNHIPRDLFLYIEQLKSSHRVYVCSNGDVGRTESIAKKLGVPVLEVHKPFGKIPDFWSPEGDVLVVGDKYLTDGLFAERLNARFIKVDHVKSYTDSRNINISYALDDVVWFAKLAVKLARPFQWVKNILVYAPLFFASEFLTIKLVDVTLACIIFSVSASAVYIFNDISDASKDALHPVKKYRPIASGQMSHTQAYILLFVLLCIVGVGLYVLPVLFLPILLYISANILYSKWLKHVAVLDMLLVASFYVVRVVAGGMVAQVPLSPWILLCVFFGALFIVVGKRRAEYGREVRREVLEEYSEKALDYMFAGSVAIAILTYGIYTIIGHISSYLVYSTFFVVLALFRVLNRIYTHPEQAESPEVLVFKDLFVLGSFVAWGIYVFIVFYIT